ncbi:lipid A deacylase LpxR family protein [Vibrio sinaloensis]|uniref:lipid A deacylase LpxR family protein n=1 Tax=Photobacterium sp. (strain ATCC 43367) TaxID=379097 RepID=UPI00204E9B38|nr:lipid A deacylase LpxR family protein [Vibrio sinaloensis]UPQ88920.1 lipid A deacylase LpxR family protein [Vibrio sinaloensis]
MRLYSRHLLTTAVALLASTACIASDRTTISFAVDNDGIFGVDQDYTNGLFLSYSTSVIKPYTLFRPLSFSYWGVQSLDKFELVLGHKTYTPAELEATIPIANDRPYAGLLYAELNYLSLTINHAHRATLTLGTTGENSLAERGQNFVHDITDSVKPRGWAYQVDDKWVANLGYLHHFNLWRNSQGAEENWELSNLSEANAGNFRSDVSTGFMLRWGTDLANNMGAANIDSEQPFRPSMIANSSQAWFVFAGVKARYRFNDITIEGKRSEVIRYARNQGQDPSQYDVRLEQTQASAVAGFAWYNQDFGIAVTTSVKTPDYKNAPDTVYGTGAFTLYAFF